MKHRLLIGALLLFSLFTMSCGLVNTVTNKVADKVLGTGDAGTVADLWSDVPRMDGLKKNNLDLPVTVKVAVQGILRSNKDGQFNFISFSTDRQPQEVAEYYSNQRMQDAGWDQDAQLGCSNYSPDESALGGAMCIFGRPEENGVESFLVIFISQEEASKPTQVFFMRLDATATPTDTAD